MVLAGDGKSAERLRKGSNYVATSGKDGEVQKNLGSFMFLKQILRETCDRVHSNCMYSPGKEDKERRILYVYATAPPLFPIQDRICEFQEMEQHNASKPATISCTWSL